MSEPTVTGESPVLICGATGRHGGTGGHAARLLLDQGHPVRALVRTTDQRARALAERGAEIAVGDFADYDSLLRALDGVRVAYFCHPVGEGITEAAGLFAAAGRERGLRRVVDLSLDAASPRNRSPQGRAQWVAEQIFELAGFTGTHLRVAAFFMENLLGPQGEQIRRTGVIRNAFGDHPTSWIAAADVGAMVAALLTDPDPGRPRTVTAGGTEWLSHGQLAEILTDVSGHPVTYTEITEEQWYNELLASSAARGAPAPRRAAHLAAQAVSLRSQPPLALTDHVRQLTGRIPITFAQFARDHREHFVPEPGAGR